MDGPVRFFLPEGGVSALDAPGKPFHDPEADARSVRGARADGPPDRAAAASSASTANINDHAFRRRRSTRLSASAGRAPRAGEPDAAIRARRRSWRNSRPWTRAASPIIGGGAGTGLSAKCEEAGGIDLIVIYNSGRYRMAGRGSLAGPARLRQRQRDRRRDGARGAAGRPAHAGARRRQRHRPVLRLFDPFLDELKRLGFSGVQNFPTVGLIDGILRANLEETGMSYALEVEMIAHGARQGPADDALCLQRDEARAMAKAGADIDRLPHGPDDRRRDRRRRPALKLEDCPALDRRVGGGGACGQPGRDHPRARRPDRRARRTPNSSCKRPSTATASTAPRRWSGCRPSAR